MFPNKSGDKNEYIKIKNYYRGAASCGACQVSAHTGNHGIASWHHYLVSADHSAVAVLLVVSGLG